MSQRYPEKQLLQELIVLHYSMVAVLGTFGLRFAAVTDTEEGCRGFGFYAPTTRGRAAKLELDATQTLPAESTHTSGVLSVTTNIHLPSRSCKARNLAQFREAGGTVTFEREPAAYTVIYGGVTRQAGINYERDTGTARYVSTDSTLTDIYTGKNSVGSLAEAVPDTLSGCFQNDASVYAESGLAPHIKDMAGRLLTALTVLKSAGALTPRNSLIEPQYWI